MQAQTQQNAYIVLQNLGDSYQPNFHNDDGLMVFVDQASAQAEIDEAIASVAEAIKAGDMDEDSTYTQEDYLIVPATIINPFAEPKDQRLICFLGCRAYIMQRSADDWTEI